MNPVRFGQVTITQVNELEEWRFPTALALPSRQE
jgi:hypothetical protein